MDELLEGCERPEDFFGDAGLMKKLKIKLMERMLGAELTVRDIRSHSLFDGAGWLSVGLPGICRLGCAAIISRLQMAGIAAVGVILLLLGAYQLGKHNKRQQSAMEGAQSITKAIQNRAGVNETINNMDSVALCLEFGGVRDQCEQLRGLGKDKP